MHTCMWYTYVICDVNITTHQQRAEHITITQCEVTSQWEHIIMRPEHHLIPSHLMQL